MKKLHITFGLFFLLLGLLALTLSSTGHLAHAAMGTITEYSVPFLYPQSITTGPDGALWFTGVTNNIGRITTTGSFTQYPIPAASRAQTGSITKGPDGALWFTENNPYGYSKIVRITTTGSVTKFTLPAGDIARKITRGPDGALWFTEFDTSKIGHITTAGIITEYSTGLLPGDFVGLSSITKGPDGALWFTECDADKIGRMTTTGSVTEFPIPTANAYPDNITRGPDGALWFTESGLSKIGRITTK